MALLFSLSSPLHSPTAIAPLPAPLAIHSIRRGTQSVSHVTSRSSTARTVRCIGGSEEQAEKKALSDVELRAGSPVIVVEAPPMAKTAEPMPMLRPNNGIINPGDVGRILERKPKDVWAVRLVRGAYLIDRKYFKPLVFDEERM